MKRLLANNRILVDAYDIILLGLIVGSSSISICKLCQQRKRTDPIIGELKKISRIRPISISGKPLDVPLIKGGDEISVYGRSFVFKNEHIAKIFQLLNSLHNKKKSIQLLQLFSHSLNVLLTKKGLTFALGGSLNYTQVLILFVPSTFAGAIISYLSNPYSILISSVIFISRFENIADPYEKCKLLCEVAAEYHSRHNLLNVSILNDNFNSLYEKNKESQILNFITRMYKILAYNNDSNNNKIICVEEPTSLIARWKLRSILENSKIRNRIQHFSKFIKQFPECNVDSENIYKEVIKQLDR